MIRALPNITRPTSPPQRGNTTARADAAPPVLLLQSILSLRGPEADQNPRYIAIAGSDPMARYGKSVPEHPRRPQFPIGPDA